VILFAIVMIARFLMGAVFANVVVRLRARTTKRGNGTNWSPRSLIAGGLQLPLGTPLPGSWFFSRLSISDWLAGAVMMAFSGVTSQCEERGFRKPAGTNFEIAVAVVPAGTKDDRSLVSESCFLLALLELAIDPDAMQNGSELAGESL